MPALTSTGVQKLRDYLQQTAKTLPAPFVGVASSQDVLFFERAGLLDPLNPEAGGPKEDSIYWFASTTKLLTAVRTLCDGFHPVYRSISACQVATLQLVDAGIFTLDTPISKYFPQLSAPYQIIRSIGDDGVPVFETSEEEITILHLANQTSGFGLEMGPEVQGWKKWSGKATGHTNTCKLVSGVSLLLFLPFPPLMLSFAGQPPSYPAYRASGTSLRVRQRLRVCETSLPLLPLPFPPLRAKSVSKPVLRVYTD